MSDNTDKPIGQNPYTDPPPIEERRFAEDPVPRSEVDFAQVMQGRGAPAPRPGYEHEQRAVPRPPDNGPRAGLISAGMRVADLLALPRELQDQALEQLREAQQILAEQQRILDEQFPRNEPANEQQGDGSVGVQQMPPAQPGTIRTTDPDEPV